MIRIESHTTRLAWWERATHMHMTTMCTCTEVRSYQLRSYQLSTFSLPYGGLILQQPPKCRLFHDPALRVEALNTGGFLHIS